MDKNAEVEAIVVVLAALIGLAATILIKVLPDGHRFYRYMLTITVFAVLALVLGLAAIIHGAQTNSAGDAFPNTSLQSSSIAGIGNPKITATATGMRTPRATKPPVTPTPSTPPTSTAEPTATPSPGPTSTARTSGANDTLALTAPAVTPTPTATTVATTASQEVKTGGVKTGGVKMDMVPSGATKTGQGQLALSFAGVDSSINGLYVEVFTSKLDARQQPAAGERVESGRTSAGSVVFDLPPGDYVVLADLPGYNWGTLTTGEGMANVVVEAGKATNLMVRLGQVTVTATNVDRVISGQYVEIYTQTPDVNGNMVTGVQVDSGRTDNTGSVSFDLTQGEYIVVSDFPGYNWGDATGTDGEAGVVVTAGEKRVVAVSLGQVATAVRGADGKAAVGVYLALFTQVPDASGNPVPGEQVDSGRTSNTGIWRGDVSPGTYCVVMDENTTCDLKVNPGAVTQVELAKP